MRSKLILRHPWKQPPETWWYFNGRDDRVLRDYAERLGTFTTPNPDDRHREALVLRDDEQANPSSDGSLVGAWKSDGALKLAELLPDEFADVRASITDHFANLA